MTKPRIHTNEKHVSVGIRDIRDSSTEPPAETPVRDFLRAVLVVILLGTVIAVLTIVAVRVAAIVEGDACHDHSGLISTKIWPVPDGC